MLLQEAKLELKKSKRKDYYKILSLSKNCTDSDVKKAYKREALKHHPGIIQRFDRVHPGGKGSNDHMDLAPII